MLGFAKKDQCYIKRITDQRLEQSASTEMQQLRNSKEIFVLVIQEPVFWVGKFHLPNSSRYASAAKQPKPQKDVIHIEWLVFCFVLKTLGHVTLGSVSSLLAKIPERRHLRKNFTRISKLVQPSVDNIDDHSGDNDVDDNDDSNDDDDDDDDDDDGDNKRPKDSEQLNQDRI